MKECVICGEKFNDWGNNPWPIKDEGECCEFCNMTKVLPARIKRVRKND